MTGRKVNIGKKGYLPTPLGFILVWVKNTVGFLFVVAENMTF
tara:strand:+ start:2100 stop:2225 length:126 start_codon:yes stop_codon:yes gene_type:complete